MTALYLVPVDEPPWRATLKDPVDLTGWDERPDDFPVEARVWGVRTDPAQGPWPRNERTWDRMEPGELLLFYRNGTGRFIASGRIGSRDKTEYIRDTYWDGGPAISVYEVQDYDDTVDISVDRVKSILGYDEGFILRGTHRVSEDRPTDRLLRRVH